MKALVKKNIGGRQVLLLFLLTNLVYIIMLTVTIPNVMRYSGGMKLLDMMPTGYNLAYVNALFNALGEKGREGYLYSQIPVDMIYPFLFGMSYCLVLAYFLNRLGKLNGKGFVFCWLPVFAGIFDYFENIGIIILLNSYPGDLGLLSNFTNLFTVLKSVFTTLTFVVLIFILGMILVNRLFKNAGNAI